MDIKDIQELLKHEIKFVYVVSKHWIWDYSETDSEIYLFRNWTDAFAEYSKIVADEKTLFEEEFDKDDIAIDETKDIEHEYMCFDIYKEGYASEYDSIIKVEKMEVK